MTQGTSAVGNGNCIVQIQGDGNSVVTGLPHLELTRRRGLASHIGTDPSTGKPREIDVIRPLTRSIEIVGREAELASLRAWLHLEKPISVRVITGGAGYGKTRLALELIEEMVPQGWRAGFLTRAEIKRFREQQNLASWGWNAPILAVVDYASASVWDLHAWLKELEDNAVWNVAETSSKSPLRILLLERHAERGSGWWAEVFGIGDDAAVLEKLIDPNAPVALPPLKDPVQRRSILTKTLARLGSEVSLPAPGEDTSFDRRIAELTWAGTPLLLMLAAVTMARDGLGNVLAMGTQDLAFNVARSELERIAKVVESQNVPRSLLPLARHVAAVVTLRQGLSAETTRQVIEQESGELGYKLPSGSAALRDALAVALPSDAGGIGAVEPDMIGEALLLSVWTEGNLEALSAIVRAYEADPDPVVKTVIRTCQDYVIRGHQHPLTWLERIRADIADFHTLVYLSFNMPSHTIELREVAAELDKAVVEQARHLVSGEIDLEHVEVLVKALNKLSNRLSDLGKREEALRTSEEAVALCRELVISHPDIFRIGLARSLNGLAVRYFELGLGENALAANEEAMTITSQLAADYPDKFRSDSAMVLSNISNCYAELGRWEEARAAIEESLALYREFEMDHPGAFLPDLDECLNNLAVHLSTLGRLEEALVAIEEAVAIRRNLVAANPDTYLPRLLQYLHNLSALLSKMGRHEEALTAIEETVAQYRHLADARPEAFQPDLAGSLNSLSNRLSTLGLPKEALAASEESVALYRALAVILPDAFRPELATAVYSLSSRFSVLGQRQDALEAGMEALETYSQLTATRPRVFQPDLADSLVRLGTVLSTLGQPEESSVAIEEAVSIFRVLTETYPDAFLPNLAVALNNLSDSYSGMGKREEAVVVIQEAVSIRRALAAARPETFLPDLAVSLRNLSTYLYMLGQREGALAAIEEAVRTIRDPFLAHPMVHRNYMGLMVTEFLRLWQDIRREDPDPALLMPILEAFQNLEDKEAD